MLKDFDPQDVGAYVDPMHMTIEGGNDGWRQGLDLLAPWIAISSLKNAKWITTGRDTHGQQQWSTRKCPLADGVAPIPQYLARLAELGYHGLYTLHSEYCDRNSWKRAQRRGVFGANAAGFGIRQAADMSCHGSERRRGNGCKKFSPVPTATARLPGLERRRKRLNSVRRHISVGANV